MIKARLFSVRNKVTPDYFHGVCLLLSTYFLVQSKNNDIVKLGTYTGTVFEDLFSANALLTAEEKAKLEDEDSELLNTAVRLSTSTLGGAGAQYPTALEQYYRNDIEWRVML